MNMPDYTKILNSLGEIKNELVGIRNLSETREERDVEVVFFTIPEAGGVRQFQIGTTSIDFKTGVIIDPDGTKQYLNLTLDTFQYLFARSLTIDSNQDIVLRIIPFKLRDVKADHTTQIEYLTYNKIEITCTQATNIKIWASTHPRNVVSEFKGAANLTQTNIDGDLIEAQSFDTVYSLLNNLNRIRNKINDIKGTTNWYDATPVDLTTLWDSSLSAVKISNIYYIIEEYSNHLGAVDNFTETTVTGSGTATTDVTNHGMNLSTGTTLESYSQFFTKASYTPSTKPIIVNFKVNNIVYGDLINGALNFRHIGLLVSNPGSSETMAGCTFKYMGGYAGGLTGWYIYVGDGTTGSKTKINTLNEGDFLTIYITSTLVKFFVNGTLVGTKTSPIPISGIKLGAYNFLTNIGLAPTPPSMNIDYMGLKVYR